MFCGKATHLDDDNASEEKSAQPDAGFSLGSNPFFPTDDDNVSTIWYIRFSFNSDMAKIYKVKIKLQNYEITAE